MYRYIYFLVFTLSAYHMPMYYETISAPSSPREHTLVAHTKWCIAEASLLRSKLKRNIFVDSIGERFPKGRENPPDLSVLKDITKIPYCHLLNNLCSLHSTNHLHIGLLAGDSLVAALYGNQKSMGIQVAIDWFDECPEEILMKNIDKYVDVSRIDLIHSDSFSIDRSLINAPIDVYFYDAGHTAVSQKKAITYYDPVFADCFILIVDDWECPWARKPTFQAFDELGYTCLFQHVIAPTKNKLHPQYVAVIRKKTG